MPFEVNLSDLSTVGVTNFDDSIQTSFTAHPKIDPLTGHLHFFGYWFVDPYLTYHVADATGKVIHTEVIPVDKPTMIHSFAITGHDVVFWECPVVFDFNAAISGSSNPFVWQPDYGSRIDYALGGSASSIRWKEIEPCYVFHEVNAFRQAMMSSLICAVTAPCLKVARVLAARGAMRWRVGPLVPAATSCLSRSKSSRPRPWSYRLTTADFLGRGIRTVGW